MDLEPMDDNPFMQAIDVNPDLIDDDLDGNQNNNNPFMDDHMGDYGPIVDENFADNLEENPFGNDDDDFIQLQ